MVFTGNAMSNSQSESVECYRVGACLTGKCPAVWNRGWASCLPISLPCQRLGEARVGSRDKLVQRSFQYWCRKARAACGQSDPSVKSPPPWRKPLLDPSSPHPLVNSLQDAAEHQSLFHLPISAQQPATPLSCRTQSASICPTKFPPSV